MAVVIGWTSGSALNMGLISLGGVVFPMQNVDPNSMESLAQFMATADVKYFLFPFLAHALGTLLGALVASVIAVKATKMTMAYVVGGMFFLGGIAVNYLITGPAWFTALDLIVAYLPMALLGGKIGKGLSNSSK